MGLQIFCPVAYQGPTALNMSSFGGVIIIVVGRLVACSDVSKNVPEAHPHYYGVLASRRLSSVSRLIVRWHVEVYLCQVCLRMGPALPSASAFQLRVQRHLEARLF